MTPELNHVHIKHTMQTLFTHTFIHSGHSRAHHPCTGIFIIDCLLTDGLPTVWPCFVVTVFLPSLTDGAPKTTRVI